MVVVTKVIFGEEPFHGVGFKLLCPLLHLNREQLRFVETDTLVLKPY